MGFLRKAAELLRLMKKIDTVTLTPFLKDSAKIAKEINGTFTKLKGEFTAFNEATSAWSRAPLDFSTVEKARETCRNLAQTGEAMKRASTQLVTTSQEALNQANDLLKQAIEMEKLLAGTAEAEKAAELVKQARAAQSTADEACRLAKTLETDIKSAANSLASAAQQGERSAKSWSYTHSTLGADRINTNITSLNRQLTAGASKSTELSNSLHELSRSTGISFNLGVAGVSSTQLPEHPLDPVKDAVIDGAIKGLEVVDSVVCLGGYNPECIAEDAIVDGANRASQLASPKLDAAFKKAEDFTAEGLRQASRPSSWGVGF